VSEFFVNLLKVMVMSFEQQPTRTVDNSTVRVS
jgi:hypothetical protein